MSLVGSCYSSIRFEKKVVIWGILGCNHGFAGRASDKGRLVSDSRRKALISSAPVRSMSSVNSPYAAPVTEQVAIFNSLPALS